MRETQACLDVAKALGYLAAVAWGVAAKMHQVTGTLVRLVGLARA